MVARGCRLAKILVTALVRGSTLLGKTDRYVTFLSGVVSGYSISSRRSSNSTLGQLIDCHSCLCSAPTRLISFARNGVLLRRMEARCRRRFGGAARSRGGTSFSSV